MNFFLVHLSLADILTAILTLIPEIAWTLTLPAFWGGDTVCKIVKFLQVKLPIPCKTKAKAMEKWKTTSKKTNFFER
jgi:hypothetical protein